jgi:hypothetical protein
MFAMINPILKKRWQFLLFLLLPHRPCKRSPGLERPKGVPPSNGVGKCLKSLWWGVEQIRGFWGRGFRVIWEWALAPFILGVWGEFLFREPKRCTSTYKMTRQLALTLGTLVAGLPARACVFCFHFCLRQLNSQSRAPYYSQLGEANAHIGMLFIAYVIRSIITRVTEVCLSSRPEGTPVVTSLWSWYLVTKSNTRCLYYLSNASPVWADATMYWPWYWEVCEGPNGPEAWGGQGTPLSHQFKKYLPFISIDIKKGSCTWK